MAAENKEIPPQKMNTESISVETETQNHEEVGKSQLEKDMAEIHGESEPAPSSTTTQLNEPTTKGDSYLLKQLEDASDDDSDEDKLHIAEDVEESPKAREEDEIKVLYDNGCPFDCCTKGLTHKLYQISDRINHEIFKRTREIENGILLKAGHPELISPLDFDDYWRNVQSTSDEDSSFLPIMDREDVDKIDDFDENSIQNYYPNVEIHYDEEKDKEKDESFEMETAAELEIVQEDNPIPEPVIRINEQLAETERLEEIAQSQNATKLIATEVEEWRVMKRNFSSCENDAVHLPPKKRGRIYRPWSEHKILPKPPAMEKQLENSAISGAANSGEIGDFQIPEQVINLSQSTVEKNGTAETANSQDCRDCGPLCDKNAKYSNRQKSSVQFSSLLEKYSHITALENGTRIYMCKMCYTTLKSEDDIKSHLYCQGVTKRVHCYLCRQDFTKENYRQHLEHHDAHPAALKCKPCGLVFENFVAKSDHHKSIHRGERDSGTGARESPYILCYLCGREFKTAKAATSHFLGHINGYPFPCSFCNTWFKGIETAVTRFVLRHNGGNTFMCGIDPLLYTGILHGNGQT